MSTEAGKDRAICALAHKTTAPFCANLQAGWVRAREGEPLRLFLFSVLSAALAGLPVASALGQDGLFDRPVLILDPGFHTATIWRGDVDLDGRFAVTGSGDRTVRAWDAASGKLDKTIRVPRGSGGVGKVYAVAIDPVGQLVAVGGWTANPPNAEQVYLFDRASGDLVHRIDGLPNVVFHLAFSPDGRYLAAMLGSANGLRVYDREANWAEIARDIDYGADSYGAAFAADGRLATTSDDGKLRLYDPSFRLIAETEAPGGSRPFGIAFSPDGGVLAVGYDDTTAVSLLDGLTLDALPAPDTAVIGTSNLVTVAWSLDGEVLYAGGSYDDGSGMVSVVAWSDGGSGSRRELPAGQNAIMSLNPLPGGDLLVAAADPWLARMAPDGTQRWVHAPAQADVRGQRSALAVSGDASVVDFGYRVWGQEPARFDLAALDLITDPPDDARIAIPVQDTLDIESWFDSYSPTLNGEPLALERNEVSRSLAIHPDGERFVLGTDWSLRAFDSAGTLLWRRAAPSPAWAVNISGDGRLAVAAYDDGTIRWHRMDDGEELLAFFPLADRANWVAWTPDGFYAATPGARGILRWHVNQGWDRAARAVPVENMPLLYRPDVIPLVLQEMDIAKALGIAELQKARAQIMRETGAAVAPGARLHVLSIGVSDYGDAATHLRLEFADDDARDVASALAGPSGGLYAEVRPQFLPDEHATRRGILRGLATLETEMAAGEPGRDLAVVFFAGHGGMVNDSFHLLPHGVDASNEVNLEDTALAIETFKRRIHAIAEHGKVLVLLDACRSGAATADGRAINGDARALRQTLATANVTVLTSSNADELSREYKELGNGAFTHALLAALGRRADTDANGLISVTELTDHVTFEVDRLTGGAQTPGLELRFRDELFAAGL